VELKTNGNFRRYCRQTICIVISNVQQDSRRCTSLWRPTWRNKITQVWRERGLSSTICS